MRALIPVKGQYLLKTFLLSVISNGLLLYIMASLWSNGYQLGVKTRRVEFES